MTTTAEPVNLSKDNERPALKLVPAPAASPVERREALYRRAARNARDVITDERTRTLGRLAVRHGMYVVGGTRIVGRRAWDGRTAARYERMIRSCEAAGKYEEIKEWEEKGRQYRAARHARRMDLLKSPVDAAKGVAVATGIGAGSLIGLGVLMAISEKDPAQVLVPIATAIDLVHWAVVVASVVWGPFIVTAPWLVLLSLWGVGRQRETAPQWALPVKQRSAGGELITPSIVVKAFRDLRISELKKAILAMEDGGASMLSPIAMAGCGVEVDVTLPSSVSTDEVQPKRRKLAENLGRHEHEVFILKSPQPRTVKLWIADSGALDEPIGPSPLVTDPEPTANYKSGCAPWGQNLRGEPVTLSLYQRHVLITGLSNQGKTAALRSLALWLAFDRSVEFWIGDLKGIGDWRMFSGMANRLIEGPTDEHAVDVTEMVEDAVEEMNRRLLAPAGTKWDPLIVIVDEAQVAFMNPAKTQIVMDDGRVKDGAPYGGSKSTSRYFMAARRIHNQGRAVDVLLWEGTQDPTDQNLPKLVREGAHIRASLVVGTESQARMALGDKAVDGGAAPHLLRQGLDKGTLVVAGDGVTLPPGEASLTVRTHFVDTEPDAQDVADRARALRLRVAALPTLESVEDVDHLADLERVLAGEKRVRTPEIIHRLKNLNPAVYTDWDGVRLRRLMTDHGEDTGTYQGYPVIHLSHVQKALDGREDDVNDLGEAQVGR
ncbi:ATP-binding protein [Streptomyces sp. CB01201]|uniref:ATP-binding protein n=1 Tax=Streptomyces sp. CB01201 TaxID=2020324 RepID=UPI001F1A8800|nr:ATP-binding protein [Streptomyces sp. CB01201]